MSSDQVYFQSCEEKRLFGSCMKSLHQSCWPTALCFVQLSPPHWCSFKGKHNATSHNYRVSTTFLPTSMCLLTGLLRSVWQVGRKMWSEASSKVSCLLRLTETDSQMVSSHFPVSFGWRLWSIKTKNIKNTLDLNNLFLTIVAIYQPFYCESIL